MDNTLASKDVPVAGSASLPGRLPAAIRRGQTLSAGQDYYTWWLKRRGAVAKDASNATERQDFFRKMSWHLYYLWLTTSKGLLRIRTLYR